MRITLKSIIFSLIVLTSLLIPVFSAAQIDNGPNVFPALVMTKIPGAPKLGNPTLITGDAEPFLNPSSENPKLAKKNAVPLISQGFGLAAPAFWDWDGDGLKDLLIGEFGSGAEFGRFVGNFIRVYPNTGTETEPQFSGKYDYARPPYQHFLTNGTPYSVLQGCCIGFTPQFTDLDSDGYTDMITGQYFGDVTFFRGSKNGFHPGEAAAQEGNPRGKNRVKEQRYWLFSSASFGDLTSDGKPDLIVGGGVLRISKNIGTLTEPRFAHREPLLDVQGSPLKVYNYTPEELATFTRREPYTAGDPKLSPLVIDWDEDGVLDLLVTNSYNHSGLAVVDFFRGVKIKNEHRFESAVPIFTTKDGKKEFPGISPHVFVTDWNNDGVNDLLVGISVVTMRGKFSGQFSWNWEKEVGLAGTVTKDPGYAKDYGTPQTIQWVQKNAVLPPGISMDDFMTLYHVGYVYVMFGTKELNTEKTQKAQR